MSLRDQLRSAERSRERSPNRSQEKSPLRLRERSRSQLPQLRLCSFQELSSIMLPPPDLCHELDLELLLPVPQSLPLAVLLEVSEVSVELLSLEEVPLVASVDLPLLVEVLLVVLELVPELVLELELVLEPELVLVLVLALVLALALELEQELVQELVQELELEQELVPLALDLDLVQPQDLALDLALVASPDLVSVASPDLVSVASLDLVSAVHSVDSHPLVPATTALVLEVADTTALVLEVVATTALDLVSVSILDTPSKPTATCERSINQ